MRIAIRDGLQDSADDEDQSPDQERPPTTDRRGQRRGTESTEERAGLKDGDDVGVDVVGFLLVYVSVRVGDTEVGLEVALRDDASADPTVGGT